MASTSRRGDEAGGAAAVPQLALGPGCAACLALLHSRWRPHRLSAPVTVLSAAQSTTERCKAVAQMGGEAGRWRQRRPAAVASDALTRHPSHPNACATAQ